jgi:ubiquinone/menaquinone biosynthesis C-methylase UbiE
MLVGHRIQNTLLFWLGRCFRAPSFVRPTEVASRLSREELANEEVLHGERLAASLQTFTRLEGRVILDLGCGKGGKAMGCAVAVPGARLIVGVDVDPDELRAARGTRDRLGLARAAFVVADAAELPFRSGCVDAAFSVNAFEHIPRPEAALREVARVLRPDGWLWLEFFPLFYSRYGSHLWDYLPIPWVHVAAAREVVLAAYVRVLERETPRLLREFAGRYDMGDVTAFLNYQRRQFLTLNKLTPKGFYRAVAASGGWRLVSFRSHNTPPLDRLLALIPGLDRFFLWGIACVLQRETGGRLSAWTFRGVRVRHLVARARQKLRAMIRDC